MKFEHDIEMSQSEENSYRGFKNERPLNEAKMLIPGVSQLNSDNLRTVFIQEPFDPKVILNKLTPDERAALL